MTYQGLFIFGGGLFAILAAGLSFFRSVAHMRFRRIFAIAKLSFKEAIRRRILYVFGAFLLLALFAGWFISSKPEDQVRTYVQVMYRSMSILLLLPAVLLAAFSIPTDIKQQTIHTIVTKPVERFEIVLGRFLGFLALMTLVLLIMTTVSLYLVLQGVTPEAAVESLKARQPLYGELRFENTESDKASVNVGREWDYRSYITRPSPGQPPQTARWDFRTIPANLGSMPQVRWEYTFDIYRTTKGTEGAEVSCTIKFYTWRYRRGNDEVFRKERGASGADPEKDDKLAEKLGYYEINSQPVVDYHTQSFFVPGGLLRNAAGSDSEREAELKLSGDPRPPALQVRITCDSPTQYVGMAKHDLYARLDSSQPRSEKWLFALNYFKGALGLWFLLALVIGLAVVFSTTFTGVVSLLIVMTLYFCGISRDFIEEVAFAKNQGGGPWEAMVRMTRRELTGPSLRESSATTEQFLGRADEVHRFIDRLVLYIIPDVDRFEFTTYVAEGFNISGEQLLMSFLLLVGYILPWMVLAYYMIKWREVASSS